MGETGRAASGGKGQHRARPGSLRPPRTVKPILVPLRWDTSNSPGQDWKGLEGKLYEDQLRSLDQFSLEKKRWREDTTTVYNFLLRGRRGADTDLFFLVSSDRT